MERSIASKTLSGLVSCLLIGAVAVLAPRDALRAQIPDPLPRPDGRAADMKKPVQVYILMGQSNMLGFGKVSGLADACKNKGLYPYLVDEDGNWTTRKDVRFVRVMCSGSGAAKTHNNEWMTIKGNIGPEMGIGHYVGHVTKAPVLILKSCIGNRSLGYDLLPPTAEGYAGNPRGPRKPKSGPWYAGVQYDGDVAAAKDVLSSLPKHYPGATRYEVAGFFWWQGDKDFRNAEHAAKYEENLLCLIESLRKDFDAPKARFVCASLGQTRKGAGGPQGQILEAVMNVDGASGKYREHKGMVASVYSHPLSKGGSSSGHYGGNAETYMNVGEAMGKAMARMILNSEPGIPGVDADQLAGPLKGVYKSILAGKWARADKALRAFVDGSGNASGDQMILALKLTEHLSGLVDGFVSDMEHCAEQGDYCRLRDELAKVGGQCVGIAQYDRRQAAWTEALASEKAAKELLAGDELRTVLAQKERSRPGAYFATLQAFVNKHGGTFYASLASQEMEPIQKALDELMAKVESHERSGDLYSKFELIKQSKAEFAKVPAFEEASRKWAEQSKSAEAKQARAAGSAYAAVFADLAKLDDRRVKALAKAKKISGRNKREKAELKARDNYLKGMKSLAGKLERLAKKYAGSYYGDIAQKSVESYQKSNGQMLADWRGT